MELGQAKLVIQKGSTGSVTQSIERKEEVKNEEQKRGTIRSSRDFFVGSSIEASGSIELKGTTINIKDTNAISFEQQETKISATNAESIEEKVLVNPTGKGIRNDEGGLGHFGAPRGEDEEGNKKLHMGLDFSTIVGQNIVAPLAGRVINFKGKRTQYPMLQLYPSKANPKFDFIQILYLNPPSGINMDEYRRVAEGEVIGIAVSLQSLGYPSNVTPHVHLELKKGETSIDPTPFFFKH